MGASGRASVSPSSPTSGKRLAFEMEPTRSINGHSNGRRTDEIELLINPESQDGRQASHHQASRSGAHAPAGAHGATDGAKCGARLLCK